MASDLADELAMTLKEEARPSEAWWTFCVLAEHLGALVVGELLQETLALEAGDGVLTRDGSRRRTPGGAFIVLAKKRLGKKKARHLPAEVAAKSGVPRKKFKPERAGAPAVDLETAPTDPAPPPVPSVAPVAPTQPSPAMAAPPAPRMVDPPKRGRPAVEVEIRRPRRPS